MSKQTELLSVEAEAEAVQSVPDTALAAPASGGIDLQRAIDTAVELGKDGVEVIRELHEIIKEQRKSEAEAEFIREYVTVKSRLQVRKNRKRGLPGGGVGHYADLPEIEQSLKRAGSVRAGFAHYWDTNDKFSTCVLIHRSGHSIRSSVTIDSRSNQGGSEMDKIKAATFQADRASLIRVWGIGDMTDTAGEDVPGFDNSETVTKDEALNLEATLREAADALGMGDGQRLQWTADMCGWAGVQSIDDFPRSRYEAALKIISERLKREGGQ